MADELTPPGGDENTADEPKNSRFGLPGRGRGGKKGDANAMAVAASPSSEKPKKQKKKKEKKAGESSGGIIGWLQDSYNGLFKIVIEPQLPTLRLTGFMLFALIFGILWAYVIDPVQYYGANPNQLKAEERDTYVMLIAAGYQAEFYDAQQTQGLLARIENPEATVNRLIQEEQALGKNTVTGLQNILPIAQQANPGTPAPSAGSMLSDILSFVLALVIFLVVINLFAIVWGLLIGGYVERAWERVRPKSDEERERDAAAAAVKADIQRRKELQAAMVAETATQASTDYGPPLTQRISTYTKGRQFDDSFAIEDANDMFLGECGATIAKTIGDSQELTAVEIWLFDKEDFVRTLKKLFVSPHAYNDPVLRAELDSEVDDPATDLIVIQPGVEIELESKMIVMKAKIADLTPGAVATLPPNSHYEGLTIQVMAWEKKAGAGASAPAAAPPVPAAAGLPSLDSYEVGPPPAMPTGTPAAQTPQPKPPAPAGLPSLDSYEIGPPPAMPSSQPTQQNPSFSAETQRQDVKPLSPPPMGPPESQMQRPAYTPQLDDPDDEDDDPFGGTADFTPIGR